MTSTERVSTPVLPLQPATGDLCGLHPRRPRDNTYVFGLFAYASQGPTRDERQSRSLSSKNLGIGDRTSSSAATRAPTNTTLRHPGSRRSGAASSSIRAPPSMVESAPRRVELRPSFPRGVHERRPARHGGVRSNHQPRRISTRPQHPFGPRRRSSTRIVPVRLSSNYWAPTLREPSPRSLPHARSSPSAPAIEHCYNNSSLPYRRRIASERPPVIPASATRADAPLGFHQLRAPRRATCAGQARQDDAAGSAGSLRLVVHQLYEQSLRVDGFRQQEINTRPLFRSGQHGVQPIASTAPARRDLQMPGTSASSRVQRTVSVERDATTRTRPAKPDAR